MLQTRSDRQGTTDKSAQTNSADTTMRVQLRGMAGAGFDAQEAALKPVQRKKNETGLPDDVKAGVEGMSGMGLDAVRVHYNSDKPAGMGAHAFARGTDIHVAPGQERHVAHEAWHVVQQSQGRVAGTQQKAAGQINDDAGLEREADVMGERAAKLGASGGGKAPVQQVKAQHGVAQMKKVPVAGGEFESSIYEANDGVVSKGAEMHLMFEPASDLGAEDDTISLVQTVKDTTKRTLEGKDETILPTTSQLGNRKLERGEEGVGEDDVGTGIDQEVNNKNGQITNTDPRYTEQRVNEQQPLELKLNNPNRASVRSAKKGAKVPGKWTHAALNDAPNVAMNVGAMRNKRFATITGGMEFEVTALHNETSKYLGSVKWGWKMSGGKAVKDPTDLTLQSMGSASHRFFKAANKWNNTDLVGTGGAHRPMQLPIPALDSARIQLDSLLGSYPERYAPEEQTEKVREAFATMRELWNGLTDDERAEATGIIGMIDRYFMKVDGRRPSQTAMWEQSGFKLPPKK